jgi:hypothetical protein
MAKSSCGASPLWLNHKIDIKNKKKNPGLAGWMAGAFCGKKFTILLFKKIPRRICFWKITKKRSDLKD